MIPKDTFFILIKVYKNDNTSSQGTLTLKALTRSFPRVVLTPES